MFSVTQYGVELDKSKYSWDEYNRIFSTKEDDLVLDFNGFGKVTFNTGFSCVFKTGSCCKFITGYDCTFRTGVSCVFTTGSNCTFNTGSYCTFNTSDYCIFRTGENCIFKTGGGCIFNTNAKCEINAGYNCFIIRRDVNGVTQVPANIEIILNNYKVDGYTIKTIEKKKEEIKDCNGKVVVIDGKEYTLQLKGE